MLTPGLEFPHPAILLQLVIASAHTPFWGPENTYPLEPNGRRGISIFIKLVYGYFSIFGFQFFFFFRRGSGHFK